ncbi:hypothetical protein ACWKSP_03870 [Micromonosporaceae bacterium Da 78-11]
MSRPHFVYDTGALLAYASGEAKVGQHLADLADVGAAVGIPDLCTMEAFSRLHHDEFSLLEVLLTHPVTQIFPASAAINPADLGIIGAMARTAGRLGAGHAAFVALTNQAEVWTTQPEQIQLLLGEQWPLIEV